MRLSKADLIRLIALMDGVNQAAPTVGDKHLMLTLWTGEKIAIVYDPETYEWVLDLGWAPAGVLLDAGGGTP